MQMEKGRGKDHTDDCALPSRGHGSHRGHRPIGALSALVVLFLFLAAPAAQAGTTGTLAVVRASGADLCEVPGGSSQQTLASGTALKATGRTADGAWVMITTPEGTIGWVSTGQLVLFGLDYLPIVSDWVAPTAAASPAGAGAPLTGRVAGATFLNVRGGPGTGYPVIDKAAAGEVVTALARNDAGDWLQIERPGLTGGFGWVSGRYLTLSGEAGDLPVCGEISDAPALPVAAPSSVTNGLTGRLVFQEASGGALYVYDLQGGTTRSLTTGADPAVSPDGRTVAFWRDVEGEHRLYLIDMDGSPERLILARGEMVRAPSWSPDGQHIVFSRVTGQSVCRDAGYGICLPDAFPYNQMFPLKTMDTWGLSRISGNGDDFRDLPAGNGATAPNWSTPGLIYQSGAGIQITGDDPDNAEHRVVLAEYRYQDPAWQPGGDRIIFQSLEKDHWEIFTATADGANVVALTRPATTLVPKLPHNVAPAWSPDGRSIVFLSNRSGRWTFWVMDADGGNHRQLSIDVPVEYRYQGEQVVSWGK